MLRQPRLYLVATLFILAGCGGTSNYPLLSPPVTAATPPGFRSGSNALTQAATPTLMSLDPADFKSRFFATGPTNIFNILAQIDDRITELNGRSGTCTTQIPVAYTIAPFGQTVTFYAQCYDTISASDSGDPGLIQWGQKNGSFYLWNAAGAAWTAAIATPIGDPNGRAANPNSTAYQVQAWFGVGYNNASACANAKAWDGCSYAGLQLFADPNTNTMELSTAGVGVGYCGAQYRSDGTNIFGTGSTDMGSTCAAVDSICVAASDASTPATCTTPQQTFQLAALGRMSAVSSGTGPVTPPSWAASQYPGGPSNTLQLSGDTNDSLHFGPMTPTPGVGKL